MRNLHVDNRNFLIVQGLKDKKGIEKNLWARIKKFIKNILYSKEQISITLLASDIGNSHTTAVRPENLGGFSGDILPFSDSKNPPHQPSASATGVKLSGEPLILETLGNRSPSLIKILLPNSIHGCKQMNVRIRKR